MFPLSLRVTAIAGVVALASFAFAEQQLSTNAAELVERVVQNELSKNADDNTKYMYKERRQTPNQTVTKEIIETTDGAVARLVAVNDQPLTAEQRAQDDAKLQHLLSDPEAMRKKRKEQEEDADRAKKMFREIPKAFVFREDGTELGKQGNVLTRLKFEPNPNYQPPSRETTVYTAMNGTLWLDVQANRLARIEATLFRDVNFGWGILGHLDKGGHFFVEQTKIGPDRWEATYMNIQFTGKALLFKSINLRQVETLGEFRRVPDNTSLGQGIEMLKKSGTTLATNVRPTTDK